jgi:hypothetical protein
MTTSEPLIDQQISDALANTAPWAIHAIRVDERRRIAKLLTDDAKTIAEFSGDTEHVVKAIAYMIGLEQRI